MRRSLRSAPLITILALGLAACGSPYKGLTKAEFLRRANANCAHQTKAVAALRREVAAATPERRAKLYREKVLPRFYDALDELAKLKPPQADRDRVKRIIAQARRDAKAFDARLKRDPVTAILPNAQLFRKSGAAATEYGLRICVA